MMGFDVITPVYADPIQKVRVQFVRTSTEVMVKITEPASDDGPISRFPKKHGKVPITFATWSPTCVQSATTCLAQVYQESPDTTVQSNSEARSSAHSHGANERPLVIKRMVDIILSATALVILSPVMLLVAIAIKLDSPGSALFHQQRAGLHGKVFRLHKFRSMVPEASKAGPVISLADPKITRVGRFLRLTSLDELPQLFNVLRGEMSLVGPRPLLPETIKPEEMGRLALPPGITGLAAVSGRQMLTWNQRMELDLWYVNHWSLRLDASILLRTLPVVLLRRGVYDKDKEMKSR